MAKSGLKNQRKNVQIVAVQSKPKQKQASSKAMSLAKSIVKALPKGSISAAGGLLGSVFGPAGSAAGAALGNVVSKIIGGGDYVSNRSEVVVNSLFDKQPVGAPPEMHANKHRTNIRHCEYLGDIVSSTGTPTAFADTGYFINPGLSKSFPWLSQLAANFETYKFNGLAYMYRSTSGESVASTNTALGTVIMAADYNAAAPNFINKVQMENYEGAISSKPSNNIMFGVECMDSLNALGNHLYVRGGAVLSGQDQKTYDLANFQIATQGMPGASTNLGELWVCYDVDLFEPKLYDAIGLDTGYFHFYNATSVANSTPFGTISSGVLSSANNLAITLTNTAISFPLDIQQGVYRLLLEYTGTADTVAAVTFTLTNCVNVALTSNNGANYNNNGTASSTKLFEQYDIRVTGSGAVINLTGSTINVPTSGEVDVFILELPSSAN